jgi:hypothetical protein
MERAGTPGPASTRLPRAGWGGLALAVLSSYAAISLETGRRSSDRGRRPVRRPPRSGSPAGRRCSACRPSLHEVGYHERRQRCGRPPQQRQGRPGQCDGRGVDRSVGAGQPVSLWRRRTWRPPGRRRAPRRSGSRPRTGPGGAVTTTPPVVPPAGSCGETRAGRSPPSREESRLPLRGAAGRRGPLPRGRIRPRVGLVAGAGAAAGCETQRRSGGVPSPRRCPMTGTRQLTWSAAPRPASETGHAVGIVLGVLRLMPGSGLVTGGGVLLWGRA